MNLKAKHKTMPYRCLERECKRHFSPKMGTFMQSSPLDYLDWLYVLYLIATNLKSVSSMKLHREIDKTQKTTWHMAHRVRRALAQGDGTLFAGPVEVDETYFGGKRRNMSKSKRARLTGRGPSGKTAVVGAKDRRSNRVSAKVVGDTTAATIQGFIHSKVSSPMLRCTPMTPEPTKGFQIMNPSRHSVYEYVKGDIHTNGIESFWSMLKRAHKGTFHRLSPKHLHRYVDEFVARHNFRELDTLDQMAFIASRMENTQLRYKDLVK